MNAHKPTGRLLGRSCMLVFALLAAGILATGYLYYRNFERHYRSEAERQLARYPLDFLDAESPTSTAA